jgi:energy-coupling factor transporter ATP-binding protein EcfA2
MLYRLEIENFFSIRDPQVLDLRVPKGVSDFPERFAPIFRGADSRAPRSVVLFGANGSGKTTVLKALAFLVWFLGESYRQNGPALPCERFNDEDSANRPIRLAVEIGGSLTLSRQAPDPGRSPDDGSFGVFRYELELQPKDGVIQTVTREALRARPRGQGKWRRVFERGADRTVVGSKAFPLAGFSQVNGKIRENVSVVADLASRDHEASMMLLDGVSTVFGNILIGRELPDDRALIRYLAQNPTIVTELNRELRRIDLGVEAMRIEPMPAGPVALFRHQGLHLDMPWHLESHGTRSFIRSFPLILLALQKGGIALIDELDLAIHPLLLPEVVRWFSDSERNRHDAQLWTSCHSASLLDDLSKEEVVLCEKDQQGRSQIYSLMDIGAVRRDDNLYRKYLGGVYGSVPHIG